MMIEKSTIDAFRQLSASSVYEASGKTGDVSSAIRPLFDGACLVGPAFTAKCMPGDLSAMRRAVDEAPAGSVLVIDGGTPDSTTWGGGATIVAKRRGLEGVITNGLTRDSRQIRDLMFPVFCAGSTVRGGSRGAPGWLGLPVAIGGTVANPGDLVVADADGAVIVARDRVIEVLMNATEYERAMKIREEKWETGGAYNV